MNKLLKFQLIMFTLFFMTVGSIAYLYQNATVENIRITVSDKQRVTIDSESKYMVFTAKESFEDTDSFFHSKYNSSDIYSHFTKGCSYEVSVYGWRIPFLSVYRNIISINKEVSCSL